MDKILNAIAEVKERNSQIAEPGISPEEQKANREKIRQENNAKIQRELLKKKGKVIPDVKQTKKTNTKLRLIVTPQEKDKD